jgi:hypothetical protein
VTARKPAPSSWWQVLPRLLHEPLSAAKLVELLHDLLPGASRVEVCLDEQQEAHGAAAPNQERITADVVVVVPRGELAVTVPTGCTEEGRAVLGLAARMVEQRLALAELTSWREHALDLVTAGEAAGALVHAVNNHLNSMLMQAMVLQMRAPGDLVERIEAIRAEGKHAADRFRPVQALRLWAPDRAQRADLVRAVQRALAAAPELARHVQAQSFDKPVLVRGTTAGLERLVWLLLRVGVRCLPPGAAATIAVEGPAVVLELPVPGQPAADGSIGLPAESLGGIGELERLAIHWLARQMAAHEDLGPGGIGLVWRVSWNE